MNQHEYVPLIQRLIDFIRIHISDIGGLTRAWKLAAMCEFFGVRTAWHGPGDASPVAHAANLPSISLATTSEFRSRTSSRSGRRGLPRLPEFTTA